MKQKNKILSKTSDSIPTSQDHDDYLVDTEEYFEIVQSLTFNDIYQEYKDKVVKPTQKPMASPKPNSVKRLISLFGTGVIEILLRMNAEGIVTHSECVDKLYPVNDDIEYDDFFTMAKNYNVISHYVYEKKDYYILNNKLVRNQINSTKIFNQIGLKLSEKYTICAFDDKRHNGEIPEQYFRQLISLHNSANRIGDHWKVYVEGYINNHFVLSLNVNPLPPTLMISCYAKELDNIPISQDVTYLLCDHSEKDIAQYNIQYTNTQVILPKENSLAIYEDGAWHSFRQLGELVHNIRRAKERKASLDAQLQAVTTDIRQIETQNTELRTTIRTLETSNNLAKLTSPDTPSSTDLTATIYYPPTFQKTEVIDAIKSALKYTLITNPGIDGSRRQELLTNLYFPDNPTPLEDSPTPEAKGPNIPDFTPTSLPDLPSSPKYSELVSILNKSQSVIEDQTKIKTTLDTHFERSFYRNEELEAQLRLQKAQADALKTKPKPEALSSISISIPGIVEFYPFEFHDFLLKTITYYLSSTAGNASYDILTSVSASNTLQNESAYQNLEKFIEKTAASFRNSSEEGKRTASTHFTVTDYGKHYKLCFHDIERYTFAIARTPSDKRATHNFEKLLKNKLLSYRNL